MNTNYDQVTENTVITFGKFKGKKLKEIPSRYLLWLIEKDFTTGQLKKYLKVNAGLIKKAQFQSK